MDLLGASLVIASNRGPVSYSRDDRGELVAEGGSGGLVTTLASAVPRRGDRVDLDEFGSNDWRPIEVRVEESYVQTVAAYGLSDVLLVNAVVDGMNFVAMEGPW